MTSIRSMLSMALLFAMITGSLASVPAPTCYTKSQKCCWTYKPCGKIVKRIRVVNPCPFKKCGFRVCKVVCKHITVNVPKEVCKVVKTPTGATTCKKVKVPGPTPNEYIWRKVCTKDYLTKNVCNTIQVPTKKRVCEKVCNKVCKTIPAKCVKFGIYHAPKFCPRRSCTRFIITGPTARPKLYFGPKVFVRHTKTRRTPKW